MFDESQRGHLKFWLFSELLFEELLVELLLLAEVVGGFVVGAVEEDEGEGTGGEGWWLGSNMAVVPLMEIFLSPPIKPAAPRSSWIIF